MLALPGSSYFYQGEELGLHEVADLPANALQDPIWLRTQNEKKGRDGCRVPLPWHHEGNAFGFSTGHAWLPQPAGFSATAVAAQEGRSGTTLEFYREALRVRHQLQTAEELTWVETDDPDVLHFTRPGGWHCLSNFGSTAVAAARRRGAADQRSARGRCAAAGDDRLADRVAAPRLRARVAGRRYGLVG